MIFGRTWFLTIVLLAVSPWLAAQDGDWYWDNVRTVAREQETTKGLRLVKKVPNGLLAKLDGERNVVVLEGSPEEIGRAHGDLLKENVVMMRARIYAAGAIASLKKGMSFFQKTDEAIERSRPFVPKRFYDEMDALADSLGIERKDVYRLNNFMELFHCSGVAARGKATKNARVLHARVLDYVRDIGIQDDATIFVFIPKGRNAWLSVSYAGFVGTVTAMNEKGLAIGEMGGAGEGKWDGLPMAFMMRRVVEECETVEDALTLMKSTPLTCDYYYVISDAKGNMAAVEAIAEAEKPVAVARPGEVIDRLPGALDDVVYISSGDRAKALYDALKNNYGKIDVEIMKNIIKRPVAMDSNLHDAIFAPESLDVWCAEAGKNTPACDEPYLKINLKETIEFYRNEMK